MEENPQEIYIVCDNRNGHYTIHFDEPEFDEKSGIFRSLNGQWTDVPDLRWWLEGLEPGHYLKFKLEKYV
jgi:hypothetical protein